MSDKVWVSPDKRIKKVIIEPGIWGQKPSDSTICTIEIINNIEFINNISSEYLRDVIKCPISVIIGEANTALDREIDKCLQTMFKAEKSAVTIYFPNSNNEVTFVLKLCDLEHRGFIHEWDAKEKCLIIQKHKEKGVELFKDNRFKDASHRFSKALKLILSIPIPVDEPVEEIDGISLLEIAKFKANLYNNLASCYSKEKIFETVIELCNKVLVMEENNVKALYKRGVAYTETRDFEKAKNDLTKVLELDADNKNNKTVKEKLQLVHSEIGQQEAEFSSMVKKMFR